MVISNNPIILKKMIKTQQKIIQNERLINKNLNDKFNSLVKITNDSFYAFDGLNSTLTK